MKTHMADVLGTDERFYRPVETRQIKAALEWENPDLIDRANDVNRIPFRDIPPFISFRRPSASSGLEEISPQRKITVISFHHGRSVIDTASNKRVIFGTPDNPLGSMDWKGALLDDFSPPKIRYDSSSPFRLRVQGLKDSVGIETMKKASRVVIGKGLPTEVPVRIFHLEEVPYLKGEMMPIETWKKTVIKDMEDGIESLPVSGGIDPITLRDVKNYLSSNDFYLVERGTQVPERVWDLKEVKDDMQALKAFLGPVFNWINAAMEYKNSGLIEGTPKPQRFDISNPKDMERYFLWLGGQIGTYLGKLHGGGENDPDSIVSNYAHPGNWSLAGTFYDLDSFTGLKINGEKPGNAEYKYDIKRTLECFATLGNRLAFVRASIAGKPSYHSDSEIRDVFFKAYIKARHPEIKTLDPRGNKMDDIMIEFGTILPVNMSRLRDIIYDI